MASSKAIASKINEMVTRFIVNNSAQGKRFEANTGQSLSQIMSGDHWA